jgi:probable F420-dependent oxidoreductase
MQSVLEIREVRRVKFGVRLPHFRHVARDSRAVGTNVANVARQAEKLGFHSVWVGDHLVAPAREGSSHGNVWHEAFTTLSYAAAVTSRVRLGTSIMVAPYRHPILAAKVIATLDVLSGGRVTVGIGTGWFEREFVTLGLSTFSTRGGVTDEHIRAMKFVWSGEQGEFDGQYVHFSTQNVSFLPLPLQNDVPIWIGGNSARAARRLAELGDCWQLMHPTLEEFDDCVGHLHRQCERVGRDPSTIGLSLEHPMRIVPRKGSRNVPLIGTADQITEIVQSYARLGADHWVLDPFYSAPELDDITIDEVLDGMQQFAEDVMPHVADEDDPSRELR